MRPGGERRGNSRDRRRRRTWLLLTFDPDLGPHRARCGLAISEACLGIVDTETLTVDRLMPEHGYIQGNIQPACAPCQNKQGALITWWKRHQWRHWLEVAAAEGIRLDPEGNEIT